MGMEVMEPMDTEHKYIDFHTHILPGIDDGAQNIEVSESMLKSLKNQGVYSVVLTPHFYSDKEPMDRFLERRKTSVEKLSQIVKKLDMQIHQACELYFTDYVFNYDDITPLCIDSGKYILIEFSFSCEFTDTTFRKIERLISSFNVVPILAHIERYPPLLKNHKYLYTLRNMGCLMQINLNSLFHLIFFKRKTIIKYLKTGLIDVVGTDCHNMTTRPPQFYSGYQAIIKETGAECANRLLNNANSILK